MGSFLISPGVAIRETDNSQYTTTQPGTGSVAALIGYAEKGSFDPTMTYGQQDFITKFGKTLEDVPYLAQAAYKYFEEGSQVLIVRAGDDRDPDTNPGAATQASKIIRLDPVDATAGSQAWGFSAPVTDVNAIAITNSTGSSVDYEATIAVDGIDNLVSFTLADTETMTYQQILDALTAGISGATVTMPDTSTIMIKSDLLGDGSEITITDEVLVGIFKSMTNANGTVDAATSGVDEVGDSVITLEAVEKGTYGNKLVLRVEHESINIGITPIEKDNVYVLLDGYEVSKYTKVNWSRFLHYTETIPGSGTFDLVTPTDNPNADHMIGADPNCIITRMENDQYISLSAVDEDLDDIQIAKLPNGDWLLGTDELPSGVTSAEAVVDDFVVGTNGWTDNPTGFPIESLSSDYAKAMQKIYNSEVYEFNLIAAPGGADPIVQNAIQSICDSRRDCFGIIDAAPVGLGLGIKAGGNDITEVNTGCSTISSSYVATYWSWVQDYDYDNDQYIWLPPSIYAMKQMVYTDNVSDPWFAPAGLRRGRVSALGVEYSPSELERDLLYGDGKIVNPIVNFVDGGITIWGQKTGQRTKSATDRINVRRLLIYAEKLIAKMARGFLFEPHDPANWAAFSRQANAILEPIRQRRGLTTYTVVFDESTNTPSLIDQNIMAGKIFVQPPKSIEFLTVDFTIDAASGATTISES